MELGQFRTLAIPPPYVPVVKSVVWMLATMVLLALARGDETRVLLGVATLLLLALVGEALGGTDRWARVQPSLRPAIGNPRFLAGCLLVVLAWLYGQVAETLPYLGERARQRLAAVGSIGAALLLLWNLSVEVVLVPLPETRFDPAKLRSAALSVLWAVYAFTAMAWGLWRDLRAAQGGRDPALQRHRAEGARRRPGGPRRALPHPVGPDPRRGPADRVLPLRPVPPAPGRDGLTRRTTAAAAAACRAGQSPAATSRSRSFRIARAALCPGAPVTSPPGWVPAPHR